MFSHLMANGKFKVDSLFYNFGRSLILTAHPTHCQLLMCMELGEVPKSNDKIPNPRVIWARPLCPPLPQRKNQRINEPHQDAKPRGLIVWVVIAQKSRRRLPTTLHPFPLLNLPLAISSKSFLCPRHCTSINTLL